MAIELTAQPLEKAVEQIAAKRPILSALRSADWAVVPRARRARALFSAGVENARFLQSVQDKINKVVRLTRESVGAGKTSYMDRSSFIADLRRIAREEGLGTGTGEITDLQAQSRLGLIYDMQVQQAQHFARWKADQDPDVLDAYPAQELVRLEERRSKRDWQARWDANDGPRKPAAGKRMVALKTDPIWERISAFGQPWPPFDFGSGMGLRDLDRAESVALGILEPAQRLEPREAGFNADLEAEASNIRPDFLDALQNAFGDQLALRNNKLEWRGA